MSDSSEILNALEQGIMVLQDDDIVYKNDIIVKILSSLKEENRRLKDKNKMELDILDFKFCKIHHSND